MGHKKLVTDSSRNNYPRFLKDASTKGRSLDVNYPIVISMKEPGSSKKLQQIIDKNKPRIIDNYAEQFAELVLSENAHLYNANHDVQVASISDILAEHYGGVDPWRLGVWAYYSWNNNLIHVLDKDLFESLRTIRNRDLITSNEQIKLREFNAVCFGMSVGSAGAQSLILSGVSNHIRLVDGAVISGSNLNRIMTGIEDVGLNKAVAIGRKLYEMNPFISVDYYDSVNNDNIGEIFDDKIEPKIVIDEIDDIEMKIKIRKEAKKRKLPVLMATELGDTVMLDVERFDIEPNRKLFHGKIPGIEKITNNNIKNSREWTKHAVNIIDPQNMTIKMQESLLKIGSKVVTHPQLGSTVQITGGLLAFAVKNIALHNNISSGRYVISFEKSILSDHKTRKYKKNHKKHTKSINKAVNSM